jgi:hypothetical protein
MMTSTPQSLDANRNRMKTFGYKLRGQFRELRWSLKSIFRKIVGRFIRLRPSLHVIGDSHAKFNFQGAPGIKIHYLGPVTMHKIARDGRTAIRWKDLEIYDSDIVVWCLGEIDVRCHIIDQARLQNVPTETIVKKLAESFLLSVASIQREAGGLKTVILAVIPPTDQVNNKEYPLVGSLKERIEARRLLNEALRVNCLTQGFHFLDPFSEFTDPMGALKESMSDGNVHCAPAFASIVVDQIRQLSALWLSGA